MPLYQQLAKVKDLTTLNMEVLAQKVSTLIQENNVAYMNAKIAHREMLERAVLVYGRISAQYRYLCRHPVEVPPDLNAAFRRLSTKRDKQLAAIQTRATIRKTSNRTYRRKKAAIEKLVQMGFQPDVDFKRTCAITFLKKQSTPAYWEIRNTIQ